MIAMGSGETPLEAFPLLLPCARGKSPMLPMANALSPMTTLRIKNFGDLQFSIVGGNSEWWDGSM
jgi:hypothetical protein